MMILKYIPNALTLFRIGLIIPFLLCLIAQEYVSAFYIFFLAGLTDGLDGWLARHFHWQSDFGSFIDPISDKLLICSSFIALAVLGSLPWWLVILVFLRDVTISIGVLSWYWFIHQKLDFEPTLLSKYNTAFQLGLVTLCLFQLAYFKIPPHLIDLVIYLTAVTTAITYVHYVWIGIKKAQFKKEIRR